MKLKNKILQKAIFYCRDHPVKMSVDIGFNGCSVDKHQIIGHSEFYNSEGILNIDSDLQFPISHFNNIKKIQKDKSHSTNKLIECRIAAGLKAFSPIPG